MSTSASYSTTNGNYATGADGTGTKYYSPNGLGVYDISDDDDSDFIILDDNEHVHKDVNEFRDFNDEHDNDDNNGNCSSSSEQWIPCDNDNDEICTTTNNSKHNNAEDESSTTTNIVEGNQSDQPNATTTTTKVTLPSQKKGRPLSGDKAKFKSNYTTETDNEREKIERVMKGEVDPFEIFTGKWRMS